ncbi:N-acetylglucosamine-6-phosphate deacetylase [soil metagenome]
MTEVFGRLVLDDEVIDGALRVEDGVVVAVDPRPARAGGVDTPFISPGLCDVHVHGFGGFDAMRTGGPDGTDELDGMARALARRGVTSFLPTGVTAPLDEVARFGERVREWLPRALRDGAQPLGLNLEGPFLSAQKRGAHDPAQLRAPADVDFAALLGPMLPALRVITVAPEIPGALEMTAWLAARGVVVSAGHSAAMLEQARAGYAAGARSTTHLFNAMSGVDHRAPGLAVAALTTDDAYVELIADGHHVHPSLWPIILLAKRADRLLLVSDGISIGGTDVRRATIGGLEIEVIDGRSTLVAGGALAGSLIALDDAVRNLVAELVPLPRAVAAASRNPLALLGVSDRGRLAAGQRADLVEWDANLNVRRVMLGGEWLA